MNDAGSVSYAQGVVPIVGLTDGQSTALVTNLIFGSMWMGALGWELVMTLPFDWRLVRETNWRSIPSVIHSTAYYLSRYSTIIFLVVYVATNATSAPVMYAAECQRRVNADAAFFIISECSVLLVFIMRTIAIWNLDVRVVVVLTLGWLITVGLAITIPANGHGIILKGFCTWDIAAAWVGSSMIALSVTSLLCLALTVIKLNRQGWRGLLKSLVPPATRSIDSEDVSRLLIQRTTLFFIVMLACIIVADVVYFTADFVLWQLIAVPAYLAISCSLAGRIFRRSWKMTHSIDYNRPPSYFPTAWCEDGSNSGQAGSRAVAFVDPFAPNSRTMRSDDSPSFVEGEFRGASAPSIKSLVMHTREKRDSKTAAELFAAESLAQRRASEPARVSRGMDVSDEDVIIPVPDEVNETANDDPLEALEGKEVHQIGAFGISEAPAFVPRAHRDLSIRTNNTKRSSAILGGPATFGGTTSLLKGKAKQSHKRPTTDPSQARRSQKGRQAGLIDSPRPLVDLFESPRPATMSSVATDLHAAHLQHQPEWSAIDPGPMPTTGVTTPGTAPARDDLVPLPNRTRLWLDSSAERARMEAAAGTSVTCLSDVGTSYARSQSAASSQRSDSSVRSPSSTVASRRGANKRLILESASEAGESLSQNHTWRRRSSAGAYTGAPAVPPLPNTLHATPSRSSFLESPAMISSPKATDARSDRSNFDFDAIRRSLTTAEQDWKATPSSHSAGATVTEFPELAIGEGGVLGSPASQSTMSDAPSSKRQARPRTAPGKVPERFAPAANGQAMQKEAIDEQPDLLDAFRQAIDEDVVRTQRNMDERPRTSRGGRFGSFAQLRDASPAAHTSVVGDAETGMLDGSSLHRQGSFTEDRPRTRNGEGATVKPFGLAKSASPIEQQYRKLQTFTSDASSDPLHAEQTADGQGSQNEADKPSAPQLDRIETRSTIESLV